MCVDGKWVTNKYDGHRYFVACGHCPACLQMKSLRRMNRIESELAENTQCFFVTFTYENKHVPYVLDDEYKAFYEHRFNTLKVYRNKDVIDTLSIYDFDERGRSSLHDDPFPRLQWLRYKYNYQMHTIKHRVGVLYQRDIQLFFKRLRITLFRNGYKGYLSYFYTGEYGEEYCRPHTHGLIFFDKRYYTLVQHTINNCWPYANLLQPRRQPDGSPRTSIEMATNPARYVSSYLNKQLSIPRVLSYAKPFKMYYHFSKGFGCSRSEFSLASLLEKVYNGTLTYNRTKIKDGVLSICESRIPKYVLYRYWPKFKGYNTLSAHEIIGLAEYPQSIFFCQKLRDALTWEDKCKIYKQLIYVQQRIPSTFKADWLLAYPRVWSTFASNSLVKSYENVNTVDELFLHFQNIHEYLKGNVSCFFLDSLMSYFSGVVPDSPNYFPENLSLHQSLTKSFKDDLQHHRIKSYVYEKITDY